MIQNLIYYLKKINELPVNHPWLMIDIHEGRRYLRGSIADAVISNADRSLITHDGRPNFEAIVKLEEVGFLVFPGERDSFGWLTGCISTNKGIIVFG